MQSLRFIINVFVNYVKTSNAQMNSENNNYYTETEYILRTFFLRRETLIIKVSEKRIEKCLVGDVEKKRWYKTTLPKNSNLPEQE